jgi:hypothetical protein
LCCLLLTLLTAIVVGLANSAADGFTLLCAWLAAAAAINVAMWLLHVARTGEAVPSHN